jgi:hypothetical protein
MLEMQAYLIKFLAIEDIRNRLFSYCHKWTAVRVPSCKHMTEVRDPSKKQVLKILVLSLICLLLRELNIWESPSRQKYDLIALRPY